MPLTHILSLTDLRLIFCVVYRWQENMALGCLDNPDEKFNRLCMLVLNHIQGIPPPL